MKMYKYNKVDGGNVYINLEDISSVESDNEKTCNVSLKNGQIFSLMIDAEYIIHTIQHVFAKRL